VVVSALTKIAMTSFRKTSVALFFTLLCVFAVACQAKKLDRKNLLDPKLSKLQRLPRFPLLTKLKEAVMPSSPPPSPVADSEVVMDDEAMDTEPVVKASGVRVVPIRNPSPPEETVIAASPPKAPTVEVSADCTDFAPDKIYTCADQKSFGKCDADFMIDGNFCARTCGRPPCPAVEGVPRECTDIPPGPDFTCAQQKEFGKCGEDFMVESNYCAKTCGRAPCPPVDDFSCPTIAEGVEGSSILSVLDLALEVTDLKDAFDDPELRVTVFAPTNAAFQDLLADLDLSADDFLEFPDAIERIIGVHVLVEPRLSDDLLDGSKFETMSEGSMLQSETNGAELYVMADYGVPAKVVSSDLDACGSIVHVIDSVLIPDRDVLESIDIPDSIITSYESKMRRVRG
jgi:uncharacterized surface protein with fasciclin (FAS1) repeats